MTTKIRRFITDLVFLSLLAGVSFVAGMKVRDMQIDREVAKRHMEAGR